MTQGDVLNILKKNKDKWFTAKELSNILKINTGSVTENLAKLHFQKNVWKKYSVIPYTRGINKPCLWKYRIFKFTPRMELRTFK